MKTQPSASMTVLDGSNNILYQQDFAPKNDNESVNSVKNWKQQYAQSKPGIGLLAGLVLTRIDSGENFAKDFFLPTVVNLAAKVENVAGRFFACFFSAILDIISFPIRFLAFPIWAIYKSCNPDQEHPMTALIRGGPASQEQIANALKEGLVHCEYRIHSCSIKENSTIGLAKERDTITKQDVALKSMPGGNKSKESTETLTTLYEKRFGKWIVESKLSGKSSFSNLSA